jgi:hypothetical protein
VRSKGETALLSTCIDAALEEESAILPARERGFSVPARERGFSVPARERGFSVPARERGFSVHKSYGNMFKGQSE